MLDFNPRAPYGARPWASAALWPLSVFQSTRPIRGATVSGNTKINDKRNFNPRAPYGARLCCCLANAAWFGFQSTRPIRGATFFLRTGVALGQFQSTRPIRGATRDTKREQLQDRNFNPRAPYGARRLFTEIRAKPSDISIHAPHTGRDHTSKDTTGKIQINFNPRAPYGARQQKCIIYVLHFCNNRQSKHKNQQETSSVRTFF